ncbi:MAG: type II secretion system protein [Phycisphaerales bacterium]|nr:type II secretion system protein [Phycisphaerales bacterium]
MSDRIRNITRAFTLAELLVVIAIIAVLLGLVLFAASRVGRNARAASCMSNQRQIALAWTSYAADQNGALVSSRTTIPDDLQGRMDTPCGLITVSINNGNNNPDSYHGWVADYRQHVAGGIERECGINSTDKTAQALSGGRLWEHLGDVKAYASPLDPTGRIRSYSLNAFVGTTIPNDNPAYGVWFCDLGMDASGLRSTHMARITAPSSTICSIVEQDTADGVATWNHYGWIFDPRAPLALASGFGNSAAYRWVDAPAMWDPEHVTYSMCDGSVGQHAMQDKALVISMTKNSHGIVEQHSTGRTANDWLHFRERILPGPVARLPLQY